jgi:tRNA (cytidine/uridine-2'-O-)-methyltransferase
MIDIALYQPEIPPNTGNIIRLCANTSSTLHIIKPMAFTFETKALRRAGLDYHDLTHVVLHNSWEAFQEAIQSRRIIGFSTKAQVLFTAFRYQADDILLFGPETRGLPQVLLTDEQINLVRIPMQHTSRSINLSNAVAIGLYESLRQHNFSGLI